MAALISASIATNLTAPVEIGRSGGVAVTRAAGILPLLRPAVTVYLPAVGPIVFAPWGEPTAQSRAFVVGGLIALAFLALYGAYRLFK